MFTRRDLLILSGVLATVGLAACARVEAADLRGAGTPRSLDLSTPSVDEVARASTDLGWQILNSMPEPNRVIAPSSLALTLGMLAEGARGATEESLDRVLGASGARRSAALSALRQSLSVYDSLPTSIDADDPPKDPVVHQASQLVVVEGHEVEQEFLDQLATYFDTGAQRVPLDALKAVLDAWVATHTAGLITQSAISPEPDLALVLQDAILFAAAWEQPFTRSDARLEFSGPTGTQKIAALSGRCHAAHATGGSWQAVRLPYDDALAMDVILPADGVAPDELSTNDLDDARRALDEAPEASVVLTMPACDLTATVPLLSALADQGISFAGGLDGIFPGAEVSEFVQQVRLIVNARGTVGAAVTEVALVTSAPVSVVQMRVDRPYLMRVLDTRTGWPLFLAVVSDADAAGGA